MFHVPSKEVEGKNFHLLMKCAKAELCFSSEHWTEESVLNPVTENNQNFNGQPAKFESFNLKPISQLLLITAQGRYVILELPKNDLPLLQYFKDGEAKELKLLSGAEHPLLLIFDQPAESTLRYVPIQWRLNSASHSKSDRKLATRIGGWFWKAWSHNEIYGHDGIGQCSGEVAGVGITDTLYPPLTLGNKSFGVRQGHDTNSIQHGQFAGEIHIYGY